MPDQYTCVQCGRLFSREDTRTPPSHCSRGCAAKTAAGVNATRAKAAKAARRITRTCERCAAPFTVERASSKVRHCSHACYRAGMAGTAHPHHKAKAQRICEQCGEAFETYPYLVRRFCSRSCRSIWVFSRNRRIVRPTRIEVAMKAALDDCGIDTISEVKSGTFSIDLAIPEAKIAIETDGTYWHSLPKQIASDARKDAMLAAQGWTVLRFGENQINSDIASCVAVVLETLAARL